MMSSLLKRIILIAIICLISIEVIQGICYQDAQFCMDKELWQIVNKHYQAIQDSAFSQPATEQWKRLLLRFAEQQADTLTVMHCLQSLALEQGQFDAALLWLNMAYRTPAYQTEDERQIVTDKLYGRFNAAADRLVLNAYQNNMSQDSLYQGIRQLTKYNSTIEELAKELVDNISVERSDSLAYQLIQQFYTDFPYSEWNQCVYYFELSHYSMVKDFHTLIETIRRKGDQSPAHAYISAMFLMSPALRRTYRDSVQTDIPDFLHRAYELLQVQLTQSPLSVKVLYDIFDTSHWQARLKLQQAKIIYYFELHKLGLFGDEDSLYFLRPANKQQTSPDGLVASDALTLLKKVSFADNDAGEQAELDYWKGKVAALSNEDRLIREAAGYFIQCLVKGTPRKKYDPDALKYLAAIHDRLSITKELTIWLRELAKYDGPVFTDITARAGLPDNRESRVALGDYDNDGFADILLNGKRLYKNSGYLTFVELTDSLGLQSLNASGGLFADFNLDGRLDLMTISHAEDGNGEKLMKNNGDTFVPVNDRAGDIDDRSPTEGAAWIDCFNDGYPDLYCANYEKWEVQSGYPDAFWNNAKGYFSDKTKPYGFLNPDYTHEPGQAGRGVAPADFDNDGNQEILSCNYRLDRNFLWDRSDTLFVDIAPLSGLQGKWKKGYYGHSIGADWGDFDNDGDLDLFIANLAHPRYIDISDVSMLLRNDGLKSRVIEGDTLRWWQFTDITRQAGITYDELHSDPLWFDVDNDGWLDLYITSVYVNDRSYLYHNNGNGTLTDITFLSGTRVYNGWGNACADFNHDGLLDLVVGSGNGTKILLNQTQTKNRSLFFKPVWTDGQVSLISSWSAIPNHPNSPAFGARVKVKVKTNTGRQLTYMRELCSAKGTTSQNDQILHFGIGRNKLIGYEIVQFPPSKP